MASRNFFGISPDSAISEVRTQTWSRWRSARKTLARRAYFALLDNIDITKSCVPGARPNHYGHVGLRHGPYTGALVGQCCLRWLVWRYRKYYFKFGPTCQILR